MSSTPMTAKWSPTISPRLHPSVPMNNPAIIDCPRAEEYAAQSPILQAAKRDCPITLPSPSISCEISIDSPQPRIRACSFIATPELWGQPMQHNAQFPLLPPQHNGYNASHWTYSDGTRYDGNANWLYEDQIPEGETFEQLDENNPAYLASVYETPEIAEDPTAVYDAQPGIEYDYVDYGGYQEHMNIYEYGSDAGAICPASQESEVVNQPSTTEGLNQPSTPVYQKMSEAPLTPVRPTRTIERPTAASEEEPDPKHPTTLMFRNIPNKYTREMLLGEIGEKGFEGKYDFFYLPIDFRNRCNVGYAFINFISYQEAEMFKYAFQGQQLKAFNSAKVCEITVANVQGKDANVEQYRNSAVMNMDEKYHPLVFEKNLRMQFPEPTIGLRPFRPRTHPVGGGDV